MSFITPAVRLTKTPWSYRIPQSLPCNRYDAGRKKRHPHTGSTSSNALPTFECPHLFPRRESFQHITDGGGPLDADTGTNEHSWEASIRAAGAVVAAVDQSMTDNANVFCAIRPLDIMQCPITRWGLPLQQYRSWGRTRAEHPRNLTGRHL